MIFFFFLNHTTTKWVHVVLTKEKEKRVGACIRGVIVIACNTYLDHSFKNIFFFFF
jgi:hypothetical protein